MTNGLSPPRGISQPSPLAVIWVTGHRGGVLRQSRALGGLSDGVEPCFPHRCTLPQPAAPLFLSALHAAAAATVQPVHLWHENMRYRDMISMKKNNFKKLHYSSDAFKKRNCHKQFNLWYRSGFIFGNLHVAYSYWVETLNSASQGKKQKPFVRWRQSLSAGLLDHAAHSCDADRWCSPWSHLHSMDSFGDASSTPSRGQHPTLRHFRFRENTL